MSDTCSDSVIRHDTQSTCHTLGSVQNLCKHGTHPSNHTSLPRWCIVQVLCLYLQYQCEDVLGDGQLLDALGVGLGRTDMVNVALAVKKLGEDPKKNVDTVGAAWDTAWSARVQKYHVL